MARPELIPINSAVALLPPRDKKLKPAVVIGTKKIRETFDEQCLIQAQNVCECPGVTDVVLNPDAHVGYGAPVGCVLVSPSHIYPGPVGVDIKCSMSLLQLNLPDEETQVCERQLSKQLQSEHPQVPGKGSVL